MLRTLAPCHSRRHHVFRIPVPLAPFAITPLLLLLFSSAPAAITDAALDRAAAAVAPQVVAWRRDLHAHPELSNREVRTSKFVADQLRSLGIEVRTGIAHTGVVGVLRGARPGPTI